MATGGTGLGIFPRSILRRQRMRFGNSVAENLQWEGNTTITGGGNTASMEEGQCVLGFTD
jgi:hypothetical protein